MEKHDRSSEALGSPSSILEQLQASPYTKPVLIASGGALAAVALYCLYNRALKQTPLNKEEAIQYYIQQSTLRLQELQLTDQGLMQKRDFFDVILLIKLKTTSKLCKEIGKNQRERVRLLEEGLQTNSRELLERYFNKTIALFEREFDQYELEFSQILDLLGISQDIWDASNDLYINNYGPESGGTREQPEISEIESKIFEFLPWPVIPKSLTKEVAKQITIESNEKSKHLYKMYFVDMIQDPYIEPLYIETVSYDVVFLDYGYTENVLRFAAQKYDLKHDPEVKEYLDSYYQVGNDR